jgi:hypothetical protein
MGLEIRAVDESEPVPKRTVLVLICDRASDCFCKRSEEFDHGGYIENMAVAKQAGWTERQSSSEGRIFVCASCK